LAGGGAETRAETRAETDGETRAEADGETRAEADEVTRAEADAETWRANPSSEVREVPLVRGQERRTY